MINEKNNFNQVRISRNLYFKLINLPSGITSVSHIQLKHNYIKHVYLHIKISKKEKTHDLKSISR